MSWLMASAFVPYTYFSVKPYRFLKNLRHSCNKSNMPGYRVTTSSDVAGPCKLCNWIIHLLNEEEEKCEVGKLAMWQIKAEYEDYVQIVIWRVPFHEDRSCEGRYTFGQLLPLNLNDVVLAQLSIATTNATDVLPLRFVTTVIERSRKRTIKNDSKYGNFYHPDHAYQVLHLYSLREGSIAGK